jgi:hypothetical protein
VINEGHLRRLLRTFVKEYHRSRTRLSLAKGCPDPRSAEPPGMGKVVELGR